MESQSNHKHFVNGSRLTLNQDRRKVLQTILSGENSKIFLPYQNFESKIVLLNLLNKPEAFYNEAIRYSSSVTFSML